MTTIKDIAKKANVSVATVSKALNGKGGSSQDTIDMIMAIARELNYTPNIFAKSLVSKQSRILGIITEDLTVFNTPEIVDSIDEYCEKNNYHYILGNLRINKRFGHDFTDRAAYHKLVDDMIGAMLSKQVEGIIYIGCHSHEISYLPANSRIPFVCAYCYSNDPSIPSVVYDDKKAAYDAVKLLIQKGHRNIGMICGQQGSTHTASRLLGYQEALYDSGILFNPHTVLYGDWERDSGYALCPQLIAQGVTAVFSQNDLMATGIIDYCNENGIAVGPELSLIGFDNREISQACRPKLSTVALPLYEIGQNASRIIIDIMENGKPAAPIQLKMECKIIDRQSVAFPAKSAGYKEV